MEGPRTPVVPAGDGLLPLALSMPSGQAPENQFIHGIGQTSTSKHHQIATL
jgi:hypothetical protein